MMVTFEHSFDIEHKTLADHLLKSGHNATYISPTIQYEMIDACNEMLLTSVVRQVNAARCFQFWQMKQQM